MKKNLVRLVALLLVAMLALTLIPMGALAAYPSIGVDVVIYGKNPSYADDLWVTDHHWLWTETYVPGSTIKKDDYDYLLHYNNKLYDFDGFSQSGKVAKAADAFINDYYSLYPGASGDELTVALKNRFDSKTLKMVDDDIKIPSASASQSEWDAFMKKFAEWISAVYVPHAHKLSCWISDGTTHWRNCLVCEKQFVYQNWCQDGDEDGICNVCGGDVPYHDITVIEDEGGKITVNRDTASHRTKITADVEVNDGYQLKKLHFTKIRDDGSRQEITRYKKNGQFWTLMPTYELEVSAEFVKK